MNKKQKEVIFAAIQDEKKLIEDIEKIYQEALNTIETKIRLLQANEQTQSKIYQLKYQEALKSQINAILERMNANQYTKIDDFLNGSYVDGFLGTMYDLHSQGIPLVFPIDQEQMLKAIVNDTKLSKSLYESLGFNVDKLKKEINNEISRGIASASSFDDIARNIRGRAKVSKNNAIRIAKTEGHRIQNQATFDAQKKAKEKGAEIVKQWDSTMDKKTRPNHVKLDGQIQELEDPFEVNGKTAMYPGDFGVPHEDINCRCVLLQRARWALGEGEVTKMNNETKEIVKIKEKDFKSFKKAYNDIVEGIVINEVYKDVLNEPITSDDEYYNKLLTKLDNNKVEYNPVYDQPSQLTDDEIISILAGGDSTSGSCASLGLAYIGQKQGWNVLDFRGEESQKFFSNALNLLDLSQAKGMKVLKAKGASSITVGNRLLKQCEIGKEYYLCVGRHAAIVRKLDDGVLQYLELQSATRSGWTNFDGNPRYTLKNRFGCTSASSGSAYYDFMIDINESDFSTDDFKSLLGYLNTAEDMQRKGKHGTIK